MKNKVMKTIQKILSYVYSSSKKQPYVTTPMIAKKLKIHRETARKHIITLKKGNKVIVRKDKNTRVNKITIK